MAARNANFTYQYHNFLTEVYNKERNIRVAWHMKLKELGKENRPLQLDVLRRKIKEGLKPSEVFLSRVPKEPYKARYAKVISAQDASTQKSPKESVVVSDMRPITPEVKKTLFEGTAKEGKGRSEYLRQRYEKIPEDKYNFPLLSSWEYGWRLGDVMPKHDIKKPKHGRTEIVAATFYNRNGIGVPPVVN